MSDLISRQAAINAFKKELTVGESKGNYVTICSAVGYEGAKQILESLPSADAIEVVRCKDCKYWDIFDIHSTICPDNRRCKGIIGKMYTPPDYYCAYGERKDDKR